MWLAVPRPNVDGLRCPECLQTLNCFLFQTDGASWNQCPECRCLYLIDASQLWRRRVPFVLPPGSSPDEDDGGRWKFP